MTRQVYFKADSFGKNPWQGPRSAVFLGQGCSIPKGETAPATTPTPGGTTPGGMISPAAAAPATPPWVVPAIAAGGLAAVAGVLWAAGVF